MGEEREGRKREGRYKRGRNRWPPPNRRQINYDGRLDDICWEVGPHHQQINREKTGKAGSMCEGVVRHDDKGVQ